MNSPSRAIVALLCALALAAVLAGCGGSSPSAQTLLNETFNSKTPINSGRLNLALSLSGSGSSALKTPIALRLAGPFQSMGPEKLPRFDLNVGLTVSGHTLQAGAVSTSNNFYIELEGASFLAPTSTVNALEHGYAQASKSASAHGSSTFASLGIDPGRWLVNPVKAGTVQIGGEEAIHLVASLNIARFLADASRLSGASNALGINGKAGSLTGLISPTEIRSIARAVKSAHVDVFTGKEDHLLRRLTVSASLDAGAKASKDLQGLRTATLALDLQLSDLNQTQTINAPSNPRPLSELIGVLQQIGVVSGGSSTATTDEGLASQGSAGEEGATGAGPAPNEESGSPAAGGGTSASPAYLECARKAGQSVEALQRCASLLSD